MARALVIANPVAARTSAGRVRIVTERLGRAGWGVDVLETRAVGDARRFAGDGVRDGVDLVVVVGGDGTTMQAAAALVGTGVVLGMIPGGTGNLLAGNLRVPRAPDRAADTLLAGRTRRIDLGRLDRADGPHWFAVACGAGIDARVMGDTPAAAKRRWGIGAYFGTAFRALPDFRSQPYHVTIDGVARDLEATMVLVANCREVIPPRLTFGPGIGLDDGRLNLVAVRANGLADAVRILWHALRGHPAGSAEGLMQYASGEEIRVETEPAQPVQLDGDPMGTTPFVARAVPGALTVVAP